MSDHDRAQGMKSAYELALERMEKQGIERPREGGLSDELKEEMAEIRRQAEAKLAELEILHRRGVSHDPTRALEEEEDYQRERRRIEEDRERKIARLRRDAEG